jgi:hypothetical protein
MMNGLIFSQAFGLWTPVLGFSGGNGTLTFTDAAGSPTGWWERFSRGVRIGWNVQLTAFTLGTATGNLQLTGHGFTNRNSTGQHEVGTMVWGGITKANFTEIKPQLAVNATAINFVACGSGQAQTAIQHGDTIAATLMLRGHLDIVV